MFSKFVLAREDPKGKKDLPGRAIARVKSSSPGLEGLFLCVVTDEDATAGDEDDPRNRDKDADAGSASGSGLKRKRKPLKADMHADIDKLLAKRPAALVAAERFSQHTKTQDEQEEGGRAGSKRKRAQEKEKEAAEADKDPIAMLEAAFASGSDKSKMKEGEGLGKKKPRRMAPLSEQGSSVKLPPGAFFEPLPETDPDKRYTAYVCGRSGCGKSHYSSSLMRLYKAIYPNRPIYGICSKRLDKDQAFEGIPIFQLPIDSLEGKLDLQKMFGDEGCMVLFDDWDSFTLGDILTVQHALRDMLNTGRKLKISVICTNHLLTDHNRTKHILAEADWVTLFPRHTMPGAAGYLCKKIGLPDEVVKHLRDMGRWVSVCNNPTMVLGESEAIMI